MVMRASPPRNLLRGDDAAQSVTAREHDAAMVNLGCWAHGLRIGGDGFALQQGATAGRAPVGLGLGGENGMAMAANSFHRKRITFCGRTRRAEKSLD